MQLREDLFSAKRENMYFQLAFMDSGLGLVISIFLKNYLLKYFIWCVLYILRFFVAGVKNIEVVDYIKLIFHGGGFAASIIINFNLGLPSDLIITILVIYLLVAAVLALVTEVYLSIL